MGVSEVALFLSCAHTIMYMWTPSLIPRPNAVYLHTSGLGMRRYAPRAVPS